MSQTLGSDQFYKEYDEAKKLEKKKKIDLYEIKLGINAHLAEPYKYWYYVNIGSGWGWYTEFGTDYAKAKTFYDNINWFVNIIVQLDKVKHTGEKSLRDIWRVTARAAGGEDIGVE